MLFNYKLGSTYLCWAFSCASMLRSSCLILIKKLFDDRKIDEETMKNCREFIMKEEVHEKIRNLIAMILVPKKMHRNDQSQPGSQAAHLRAAVSRVSTTVKSLLKCKLILRLPILQYLKMKVYWCYSQFISSCSTTCIWSWPSEKFSFRTKRTKMMSLICEQ